MRGMGRSVNEFKRGMNDITDVESPPPPAPKKDEPANKDDAPKP